ncbi:hypothetical protein [Paenibacillus dendritiformis]|uniref:hypothetical protein n=1 Tax=Paenibacillus dendritiformis TaxID=130049 RepID=UPI0011B39610|nr:hypothetical protein [Paenibacillus dendritiformis]
MARSVEERLQELQEKKRQLEEKEKLLKAQMKTRERKERTRRLIQIGGIFASIGIDSVEKADKLKKEMEANGNLKMLIDQIAKEA